MSWAVAACAVGLMGACASKPGSRRAFFAPCAAAADCESGLCYVGVCSKSCTLAAQCGSGICIDSKCKPVAKVGCTSDADCQSQVPDNGCRTTTCEAGACHSQTIAAATFCAAACEKGAAKPGSCSTGHCIPTQGAALLSCTDDNPCTADDCAAAKGCTHAPLDGDGCDDGDACTAGDQCTAGACKAGSAKSCADDGNPCTTEACDQAAGCQSVANAAPCDDGNPCTSGDGCAGGKCQGAANTQPCDDGDPCSAGDLCSAGACKAGQFADCADDNPCTLDQCQPKVGCAHLPMGGSPCDDGNLCTIGDKCGTEGSCAGAANSCADNNLCTAESCDPASGCKVAPATGPACDDGNPCTAADTCQAGACVGAANTCNDGNPCTQDACSPVSGACAATATSGPCDDGLACTDADACDAAATCKGKAVACDDGNPCTSDICDDKAGCVATPADGKGCSDGNPCTGADACQKGACAGVPQQCVDGNPCTLDLCNPSSGACANPPGTANCDDGDPCTGGDGCAAGVCTGVKQVCNDSNPCTVDACNPATSQCEAKAAPGPCDDGKLCTKNDACAGGGCFGEPNVCSDGNPCTAGTCNEQTGKCGFSPVPPSTPCDDGNACTSGDICGGGTCTGAAKPCGDTNPCTADNCVNGSCVFTPAADGAKCEDGNPCTVAEICQQGICANAKAKCDDGNVCTVESCAADGACNSGPNPQQVSCEGPQPCGGQGVCEGAVCKLAALCNDGNPCTADACDQAKGCVHVPQSAACDDSIACTIKDSCVDGLCKGTAGACTDDNPCTTDKCDPKIGCVGTPNPGAPCNDGNACSSGEVCTAAGLCKGKASMWMVSHGMGAQTEGRGVAVLGDVAVFAGTRTEAGKDPMARLIGHDVDGPQLWDLLVNGQGDDALFGVTVVGKLFVAAGTTSAAQNAQRDGLWLAVNAEGKQQWQVAHGGGDDEVLLAVAAASDSVAVGVGYRDTKPTRMPLLMTVGSVGAAGLNLSYSLGGVAQARGVAALADGFLLVGDVLQADGKTKGFAVRTAADGKQLWQQAYGGALVNSELVAVIPTATGFTLAGTTQTAITKPQVWWVATDAAGKVTAQFQYAQSVNARTLGMVAADQGYMLFGYADFGVGFGEDFLGVRVDTFGNFLYQRSHPIFGSQRVYAGAPLPDGGAMAAGAAQSGSSDLDLLAGRANPWGILLCGTEGQCGKLLPKDCDDGKPCTADNCIDVKGCVSTALAEGASCPTGKCAASLCK